MEDIDMKALLIDMAQASQRMCNTYVDIDGTRYSFYELLRNYLYPNNAKVWKSDGL
jgi:hypothetical protein